MGLDFGRVTPEEIVQQTDAEWYRLGYGLFSFDDGDSYRAIVNARRSEGFESLEVLAFIGLWCGDTHDQLPGLIRILDAVKFPREQLRMYSLDRAKTFPGGEDILSRYEVRRLPTFVFLRRGAEIGRIIETPRVSLLRDIAEVLGNQ